MIMIFLPALADLLRQCVRSGRLLDGTPARKPDSMAVGILPTGAIPTADAGAAHLFKLGGKGVFGPVAHGDRERVQVVKPAFRAGRGIWLSALPSSVTSSTCVLVRKLRAVL